MLVIDLQKVRTLRVRTETRQVVVEQEVYIADDGTEFDDEDDCKGYEIRLAGQKLKMYDYTGKAGASIDYCQYVKLTTERDVEAFIEVCKFDGISYRGIEQPGVYTYVEGSYGRGNVAWVNISKIMESIEESEDTISGN